MTYHPVNYGFTGSGGLNFALVQTANDLKDVGKHPGIVLLDAKNICDDKVAKKNIANFSFARINVRLQNRLAIWIALCLT